MAIAQRRYIRVTFDIPNSRISIVREDTTTTTTTMSTVPFEGGVKLTTPTVADTPDGFGKTAAASFTANGATFSSTTGSAPLSSSHPKGC